MEQMTITAKIQIATDPDQRVLLDATMDAYRRACDYVSDHVFRTHDLSQCSLNRSLYFDLRECFGLRSQMAQSAIKTVIARYKSIQEAQKEWIRPRFRSPQYDLVWNRDYSLTAGMFSVNTLEGRLKLPYFAQGMEKYFDHDEYSFGTAKLVKRHGKYFLHIPVTFRLEAPACTKRVAGVDLGINFLYAAYDGKRTMFCNGRAVKQKRAQYVKARHSLQRRHTSSSRRRLKAIGQRENRWMRDVDHAASKALVEAYPEGTLLVMERLSGIRGKTDHEHVRTADQKHVRVSWAFYDFQQKIEYKARMAGSAVTYVDPYKTSQACPMCGNRDPKNRNRRMHMMICTSCGYRSNDDRAAAMNLHSMGIYGIQSLRDAVCQYLA